MSKHIPVLADVIQLYPILYTCGTAANKLLAEYASMAILPVNYTTDHL